MAHSVRGASHLRAKLPNQDSFSVHQLGGERCYTLLAVADGHGSSRSFRSEIGSRLAVRTALEVVGAFVEDCGGKSLDQIEMQARRRLPKNLVHRWRHKVSRHLASVPLQEAEFGRLVAERGEAARKSFDQQGDLHVIYGSTLLLALICDCFGLYLRLGDGEIMLVNESSSEPVRIVRDAGTSMLGDETYSLCMVDAETPVQITVESFAESAPQVVMLCTDGYEKSFASREGFERVGSDLLAMLRSRGPTHLAAFLPQHLREVSDHGAGDDVTMAIAWQPSALQVSASGSAEKESRKPDQI